MGNSEEGDKLENSSKKMRSSTDGEIIGNSIILSLKTLIYYLFMKRCPNFLYLTSLGILRFILTGTNILVFVGGNTASPHYQYTSLT